MENLTIEETKSTPRIIFDAQENILEIKGRSYPEDAMKFYKPAFDWLKEYVVALQGECTCNISLIYINTSSRKIFLMILKLLEKAHSQGNPITINWYYHPDNENAKELGEEYKEEIELPFNLIEEEA